MSNRELRFRAFGADGRMVYGVTPNGRTYIELLKVTGADTGEYETFDALSIMQYTGLHDKNGVDIYEGDIVEAFGTKGVVEYFTNLNWDSGGSLHAGFYCKEWFEYKDYGCLSYHVGFDDCEVLGNIYENLELMK